MSSRQFDGVRRGLPDGRSWTARLKRIAEDRAHGATYLAGRALDAIQETLGSPSNASEQSIDQAELRALARALAATQPAMGPFLRWSDELLQGLGRSADVPLRPALLRWIRTRRHELDAETGELVRAARGRLPTGARVLTISRSESVLGILSDAHRRGRGPIVYALESRPGGEGRSLARELRATGVATHIVPDRRAAEFTERASIMLVGADAVLADGSIVHKVGTRPLAEAAHRVGIPVCVAAGRSKFVPHRRSIRLPDLFDRTPARLVTEVWTARAGRDDDEPGRTL